MDEEFDRIAQFRCDSISNYKRFVGHAIWHKRNGEDKDVSYILMEHVDGISLHDFLTSVLNL